MRRKKPWSQKLRLQWLKDEDKNTKYFNASIVQGMKTNRVGLLEKDLGGWCKNEEEVVEKIYVYY